MDRATDSLTAMKEYLHGLENVKILNPDDIEILWLRRVVRQKLDRLEREEGEEPDSLGRLT